MKVFRVRRKQVFLEGPPFSCWLQDHADDPLCFETEDEALAFVERLKAPPGVTYKVRPVEKPVEATFKEFVNEYQWNSPGSSSNDEPTSNSTIVE